MAAPTVPVTGKTLDALLTTMNDAAAAHDDAEVRYLAAKEARMDAARAYDKAATAYERAKAHHGGIAAARTVAKAKTAVEAAAADDAPDSR